jgi:hypothetical protein
MKVPVQRGVGGIGGSIHTVVTGENATQIGPRVGDHTLTGRNVSLRIINLIKR